MSSASSVSALVRLPTLGFGAAPLGNLYRARSDHDCESLLEAAWSRGIRYFDTAPLYGFGLSERRLGAFLQKQTRSDFLVSTKVGRVLVDNPGPHVQRDYFIDADPYEPVFDYSYDGIMRSYEASLKRLGLDRVDILLMHDIGKATHGEDHEAQFKIAMNGGYRAMDELRRSGDVSAIGLGVNEWEVCAEAITCGTWDCMLLAGRYTLLEQGALDFLDLCADTGLHIISAGPFNSGILATGANEDARFNYDAAPAPILARVKQLADICALHDTALGAAAIQFPIGHPAIATVIAGFGSLAEFNEVLAWASSDIPSALWLDLVDHDLLEKILPIPKRSLTVRGANRDR